MLTNATCPDIISLLSNDRRRNVNGPAVLPRMRIYLFKIIMPSYLWIRRFFFCKIYTEVKSRMPNAKVLSEKQAIVAAMVEQMQAAKAGVFVDYKGITVEADTKFRSDLRANNVQYSVVKNTLTRFAANQVGFEELDPILNGTTALAISAEDPIAPCRLVGKFIKDNPKSSFAVKGGFVEGKVVSVDTIMALSELTNKNDLVATVLGTLNAPIAALARALNAIAEKQGAPAAEAAAE